MSRRPWTDEEYGFLADHPDWSAQMVGEALGRSKPSVQQKRDKLRAGWTPRLTYWSPAEDEILRAASSHARASDLLDALPGRSLYTIRKRRHALGVEQVQSNQKRPSVIGSRPLIAKSCSRCGLLLAADWFYWIPRQRIWSAECKKCRSRDNTPSSASSRRDERRAASAKSHSRYEALTRERAHRHRQPWTTEDFAILADPELSVLQKALRTGRTWTAVAVAASKNGFKSHRGLGDPEKDIWRIENPNAPRDFRRLGGASPTTKRPSGAIRRP